MILLKPLRSTENLIHIFHSAIIKSKKVKSKIFMILLKKIKNKNNKGLMMDTDCIHKFWAERHRYQKAFLEDCNLFHSNRKLFCNFVNFDSRYMMHRPGMAR